MTEFAEGSLQVTGEPERPEGVSDDSILRVIRVPPESHGMRLDRFLCTQLRATSRTRAQSIIKTSAFSWEGRRLRSSQRVKGEQHIVLWRPAMDEGPLPAKIEILYQDEQLLVVDKPTLMTVHPTARHHKHTLIKRLEEERAGEYLALIHRLDRETSGVLLVARSRAADSLFKSGLERRSLEAVRRAETGEDVQSPPDKTYIAITWGIPKNGIVTKSLTADPSPLRVKMSIAPEGKGLLARTGIEVIDTAGNYALVHCHLYTGRQHQIRVHLASLGTPIVGDKLYGPDERLLARGADNELTEDDLRVLELPRHALHAAVYRLVHPFTQESIELRSELPDDLTRFWQSKKSLYSRELRGSPSSS